MNKTISTFFLGSMLAFGALVPSAFATEGTPSQSATNRPINVSCVQSAVDVRENALLAAFDAFHTSVRTALTTRQTALKDAWAKADKTERRMARAAAHTAYRQTTEQAHSTLRTARNTAYNTFNTSMRACVPAGYSEKPSQASSTSL